MVSALAWPPWAAAGSSMTAAPRAVSAFRPDLCRMRPIVGRLKQRADFLRVAAVRHKWATPGMILQAAPQPPAAAPLTGSSAGLRVGFTCSKKVGNAVARNRARRRLRAAAAALLPELAMGGFDYVLIGRTETLTRPYPQLLKDLRLALRKLGVLRPAPEGPGPFPTGGEGVPS